jgi:hypothetical protein
MAGGNLASGPGAEVLIHDVIAVPSFLSDEAETATNLRHWRTYAKWLRADHDDNRARLAR